MLQIKNTLGGGKPEGLYAWKKYGYIPEQTIVNPTFHINANVSTQKATITSDDINFKAFGTLTDNKNFYQSREPEFCNFMNGFNNSNSSVNFAISTSTYSGQLELNYSNNSYWNAFTKMTPTDTGAELTASNLFKTTIDDTLQYTGTKTIAAKIGEFISYVVSDKETAYPDGGEKGGYWYERVGGGLTPEMFGCTKFAIDEFVVASRTSTSSFASNISHSLGEAPKVAIISLIDNLSSLTNKDVFFLMRFQDAFEGSNSYHLEGYNDGTANMVTQMSSGYGTYIDTMTNNNVPLNCPSSSYYWQYFAVGTYKVITMA